MKRLVSKAFLLFFATMAGMSGSAAQTRQDLGNPARMRAIQLHPSPGLLEYQAVMMPVQRVLMQAYYAGICQFRSGAFFQRFQTAAMMAMQAESAKRNLSNAEIAYADRAAKQIMAEEDREAGFGDLEKRCRDLRPKLASLDALERDLTGNYH